MDTLTLSTLIIVGCVLSTASTLYSARSFRRSAPGLNGEEISTLKHQRVLGVALTLAAGLIIYVVAHARHLANLPLPQKPLAVSTFVVNLIASVAAVYTVANLVKKRERHDGSPLPFHLKNTNNPEELPTDDKDQIENETRQPLQNELPPNQILNTNQAPNYPPTQAIEFEAASNRDALVKHYSSGEVDFDLKEAVAYDVDSPTSWGQSGTDTQAFYGPYNKDRRVGTHYGGPMKPLRRIRPVNALNKLGRKEKKRPKRVTTVKRVDTITPLYPTLPAAAPSPPLSPSPIFQSPSSSPSQLSPFPALPIENSQSQFASTPNNVSTSQVDIALGLAPQYEPNRSSPKFESVRSAHKSESVEGDRTNDLISQGKSNAHFKQRSPMRFPPSPLGDNFRHRDIVRRRAPTVRRDNRKLIQSPLATKNKSPSPPSTANQAPTEIDATNDKKAFRIRRRKGKIQALGPPDEGRKTNDINGPPTNDASGKEIQITLSGPPDRGRDTNDINSPPTTDTKTTKGQGEGKTKGTFRVKKLYRPELPTGTSSGRKHYNGKKLRHDEEEVVDPDKDPNRSPVKLARDKRLGDGWASLPRFKEVLDSNQDIGVVPRTREMSASDDGQELRSLGKVVHYNSPRIKRAKLTRNIQRKSHPQRHRVSSIARPQTHYFPENVPSITPYSTSNRNYLHQSCDQSYTDGESSQAQMLPVPRSKKPQQTTVMRHSSNSLNKTNMNSSIARLGGSNSSPHRRAPLTRPSVKRHRPRRRHRRPKSSFGSSHRRMPAHSSRESYNKSLTSPAKRPRPKPRTHKVPPKKQSPKSPNRADGKRRQTNYKLNNISVAGKRPGNINNSYRPRRRPNVRTSTRHDSSNASKSEGRGEEDEKPQINISCEKCSINQQNYYMQPACPNCDFCKESVSIAPSHGAGCENGQKMVLINPSEIRNNAPISCPSPMMIPTCDYCHQQFFPQNELNVPHRIEAPFNAPIALGPPPTAVKIPENNYPLVSQPPLALIAHSDTKSIKSNTSSECGSFRKRNKKDKRPEKEQPCLIRRQHVKSMIEKFSK